MLIQWKKLLFVSFAHISFFSISSDGSYNVSSHESKTKFQPQKQSQRKSLKSLFYKIITSELTYVKSLFPFLSQGCYEMSKRGCWRPSLKLKLPYGSHPTALCTEHRGPVWRTLPTFPRPSSCRHVPSQISSDIVRRLFLAIDRVSLFSSHASIIQRKHQVKDPPVGSEENRYTTFPIFKLEICIFLRSSSTHSWRPDLVVPPMLLNQLGWYLLQKVN